MIMWPLRPIESSQQSVSAVTRRVRSLRTTDFGLKEKRMQSYPTLRRWFAATATAVVFAGVVLVMAMSRTDGPDDKTPKEIKSGADSWVMYGGSPSRNMVNTHVKNLPVEWDVDPKKPVNIRWVADLGSKSYGGPVVAGGKVFVGTNNQRPREKFLVQKDKKI